MGRISALAAILVGAIVLASTTGGPRFRVIRPGVEFAKMRGEPFTAGGPSAIAVLRIDPARVHLSVRHYSGEPEGRPLSIVEWQRRTGAIAVFNAGQYYPDYSYMGLLVSNGRTVSARLHPTFKAALVAEPRAGSAPRAQVIDLEKHPIDPKKPGWREVAQSFMLFDRGGNIRIRKSGQVANRTVVAEDRRGRLLVITSEGAYTLHDFATLLRDSPLQIEHAMSMDGGLEAELCVHAGDFRYASFGPWPSDTVTPEAMGAQVPLPAVVAVTAK